MSGNYIAAKRVIPGLLERGPLNQSRLVDLTGMDSNHVSSALKSLIREGKAKRIGKAGELGMTQFKRHAELYALSDYVIPAKPVERPEEPKGEYAEATRRTYANIIFPGAGSRRGL